MKEPTRNHPNHKNRLPRPLIIRFIDSHDGVDFNNRLIDHIVEFALNGIGAGQEEVR